MTKLEKVVFSAYENAVRRYCLGQIPESMVDEKRDALLAGIERNGDALGLAAKLEGFADKFKDSPTNDEGFLRRIAEDVSRLARPEVPAIRTRPASADSFDASGTWVKDFQTPTMTEIVQAVARGWCSPNNSHKLMDSELAYAIAVQIEAMLKRLAPQDGSTK